MTREGSLAALERVLQMNAALEKTEAEVGALERKIKETEEELKDPDRFDGMFGPTSAAEAEYIAHYYHPKEIPPFAETEKSSFGVTLSCIFEDEWEMIKSIFEVCVLICASIAMPLGIVGAVLALAASIAAFPFYFLYLLLIRYPGNQKYGEKKERERYEEQRKEIEDSNETHLRAVRNDYQTYLARFRRGELPTKERKQELQAALAQKRSDLHTLQGQLAGARREVGAEDVPTEKISYLKELLATGKAASLLEAVSVYKTEEAEERRIDGKKKEFFRDLFSIHANTPVPDSGLRWDDSRNKWEYDCAATVSTDYIFYGDKVTVWVTSSGKKGMNSSTLDQEIPEELRRPELLREFFDYISAHPDSCRKYSLESDRVKIFADYMVSYQ